MKLTERIDVELLTEETNRQQLSEAATFDQLILATKAFWRKSLDKGGRIRRASPPTLVILKSGDTQLDFAFKSAPPDGSGRTHVGNVVFMPDAHAKKGIIDAVKGWWKGLKSKFLSMLHKPVPPEVLKASDLRKMKCKVSCSCEDYKYRKEVANHIVGASDIKHSNGKAPVKTNPNNNPGLCKHLVGVLGYLTDTSELKARAE